MSSTMPLPIRVVVKRRAFTLVELLVVIAIIGVLVGLLLPAVQAAREAARRSSCINNLKQFGIAIHNHANAKKTFPGALEGSGRYNSSSYHAGKGGVKNTTGWARLLPYMDQQSLYDRYNFSFCSSQSSQYGIAVAGDDTKNDGIYNAKLPILECPSTPSSSPSTLGAGDSTQSYSRRNAIRTGYLFSSGNYTDYDAPYDTINDIRKGAFGNETGAALSGIPDGTSKTLAIGESVSGSDFKTSGEYGPWGMTGTHTCCHGRVVSGVTSGAIIEQADVAPYQNDYRINASYGGDFLGRQYAWGFGSRHGIGAQFVFCDGSTRMLADSIDYLTFARMAFIADGKSVDVPP